MISAYEDSTSTPEKLALLVFIAAIVIGNICVFITYIVRSNGKHWSNMFVLGMAFIDLFIGSFVLPMRFISAYGSPLTSKLCAALAIGESCALAAVIYAIGLMIYTRLYDLKQPQPVIRHRFLILLLIGSWIVLFLFYGIPFMTNYSNYLQITTMSTSNTTSYCATYTTSVYHPPWMAYTEIGIIYGCPLILILIGIIMLFRHICVRRSGRLEKEKRKRFIEQRMMTWHVVLLSIIFVILWLPWIIIRILLNFDNTQDIRHALHIAYYILILKSVLFPILYASTNTAFRGSFTLYRRHRLVINNRVWTVNNPSFNGYRR